VISPYWVSYPEMIKLNGGKTIYAQTLEEEDWKVEVPDLAELITVKTKILILNSASNPTGSLYSREELKAILEFTSKNNILVISDEVYSTLVYDNNEFVSVASFPEYTDNVIVVQSASKMFAITGLRVGFLLGNTELIKRAQAVQSHATAGTSSISQHVVYKLLEDANAITKNIKDQIEIRRDLLMSGLQNITDVPSPKSALYSFLRVDNFSNQMGSEEFCIKLLEEKGIATVPGIAFGNDDYFRISFGVKKNEIARFLEKIYE
jgi:aspartate/methionine/tyrosine aminotransferase